ncbi:MAG: SMP-30/gluconolactonase/LRE family protein [Caulobacteraceae bacterium]|nr:SMP-30/gluconolactonase/LRE family protein [Caulobacteraceae bacterium]
MSDYRVIAREGRDVLGEGPMWSARENAVYWVDIKGPRLWRLSLADEAVRSWPMPEAIGWVVERQDRASFIAGFQSGFAALTLNPFSITPLHDPEPDRPDNRLNDAKADAAGRIWAGTMDSLEREATGSLYRLDPDLTVSHHDSGYHVTNGPAFSPEGDVFYHTDSARRTIYAFDMTPDGRLENKRVFVTFEDAWGYPDGMTTDAEGGLWVAHWAGSRISRFLPDGALDRSIALPASRITSCAFAGENLDRMFVTSAAIGAADEPQAGQLFEVAPGVRGLPTQAFAG